ncbi:MAG: DUF3795 domain-containing protein [Planctomycetota bacterium]|jgi:hypothetical protein
MKDKKELTAPCGLDCFNCELYPANLTDEIVDLFAKRGVPANAVSCKGCRAQGGCPHFGDKGCATLDCAKEKGVELCSDCSDFPCVLLAPLADGADRYPHNFKLYNLCRIKLVGIDRWIDEEAGRIRHAYFSKRFVAGKGQADQGQDRK